MGLRDFVSLILFLIFLMGSVTIALITVSYLLGI